MARSTRITLSMVLAVLVIAPLFMPLSADAAQSSPGILPPQSSPGGLSYGQWSARWWQWALGQPTATNPLLDTTGANCTAGQSGSVWFLAGTLNSGTVNRSCTVPSGRMVLMPVANAFCSAEGDAAQMRACAKAAMDAASNISVQIDGVNVPNLASYRVESPIFTLNLPDGNVFGAPAGPYSPTAADGIYVMLAPLSTGTHTIHAHAEFAGGGIVDVTYQLKVQG